MGGVLKATWANLLSSTLLMSVGNWGGLGIGCNDVAVYDSWLSYWEGNLVINKQFLLFCSLGTFAFLEISEGIVRPLFKIRRLAYQKMLINSIRNGNVGLGCTLIRGRVN